MFLQHLTNEFYSRQAVQILDAGKSVETKNSNELVVWVAPINGTFKILVPYVHWGRFVYDLQ